MATGALLIYPEMEDDEISFTVQHAGIELSKRDGAPHGLQRHKRRSSYPALSATWRAQAVTAVAMLVRRDAFQQVGGFDEGYVYGAEDVDLCLRLAHLGQIVVSGDAALFHYESASQRGEIREMIRINRIGNWRRFAERWGPTLNRTLTEQRLMGRGSPDRPSTVAITLTRNNPSSGWGDYYTAHELGEAFEARGWRVIYAERHQENWYEIDEGVDLIVSLLDAFDVRKAPRGAYTIAWVRNWVERWIERPYLEAFDLVVASSNKAAAEIAERTRFDPKVVPLATNPERFAPGPPVPTFEADYAFTGNNWGAGRDLIPMLEVRPGERLLVFGKGWESEPRVARYWRGHLDYGLLPDLYRSVKLVLDDTAGPTLPYAFLNGRVFDALASGTLVLSDNREGSDEMFGGLLPTYETRAELRTQLDKFLGDDKLREKTAIELRDLVLQNHTYEQVPDRLIAAALADIDRPRVALKIGVPHVEEMEQWGDTHFAAFIGYRTGGHWLSHGDPHTPRLGTSRSTGLRCRCASTGPDELCAQSSPRQCAFGHQPSR